MTLLFNVRVHVVLFYFPIESIDILGLTTTVMILLLPKMRALDLNGGDSKCTMTAGDVSIRLDALISGRWRL